MNSNHPNIQEKKNLNSRSNKMVKDFFKILIIVLFIMIGWASAIIAQMIPEEPVPPPKPLLKAVPGDGQVLLYWDERAESHFDEYLESIGINPENFEGYKVYKSTDPDFIDALRITDNLGNRSRLAPEAQFDLPNEISGYHPAAINGTRFFLGSDSGIQRQWLDTDVINGRAYYYAVVAYTHGDAIAGFPLEIEVDQDGNVSEPLPTEVYTISPLESELDIIVNSNGTVQTGINTIRVVPQRTAAGVMAPVNPTVNRLSGSAGGTVEVEIIDPVELIEGAHYSVVFQDTVLIGDPGEPDLPTTKNFSLINEATGNIVFDEVEDFSSLPLPIREGFRLIIESTGDTVRANLDLTQWETTQPDPLHQIDFNISTRFPQLADYKVEFSDEAIGQSNQFEVIGGGDTLLVPQMDVNFRVFNETTGEEIAFAYSPNSPRSLNSVFFVDEFTGYSAGFGGLMQKTEDGGDNWMPLQSGVLNNLNDIYFTSANTGYAVGNNGVILKTVNGGDLWEDISPEIANNNHLHAVQFLTSELGFIVGASGILLRTVNAGESWIQTTPADRNMNAIFMVNENVGYIAGLGGRLYRTDDGGNTWVRTPPNLRVFNDLFFFNQDNGIAVANGGRIFTTNNGGESFTETVLQSINLHAIQFLNDNDGLIVGDEGNIYRTNDGGENWELGAPLSSFNLFDVFLTENNDLHVVGNGLTRLKSTDQGANFSLSERVFFFRSVLIPTQPGSPPDVSSDEIFFIEDFGDNENVDTWKVSMLPDPRGLSVNPVGGDVMRLVTVKPFTSADSYSFSINQENTLNVNEEIAKDRMSDIRVVPNPYLVTHLAETDQDRQLHFTNLPANCTIRIFSVSGRLIQTLEVSNSFDNDRYIWDLRTNTNSPLPYGVYIYKVTAPDVGEKVGKFAVIK